MALIPHSMFPRSMFDMDKWFKPPHLGPNTMDLFDPFDELDHTISRNLEWLNKPEFISPFPLLPRVPQKYRITVDCVGYKPSSIKTEIKNGKLCVTGREEERTQGSDDFHVREFKKTYELPENAETDKMISFVTGFGDLVVEVPLKETTLHPNMDLFPKIIEDGKGGKQVSLKFAVPEQIDPSKVHIFVKDRDLVVKAEKTLKQPDSTTRVHYYKRTTLPENTKFDALKCNYNNNHEISIEAPLSLDYKPTHKKIPIECKPLPAAIKKD